MHLLYAIAAILSCAGTAFAEQGEAESAMAFASRICVPFGDK